MLCSNRTAAILMEMLRAKSLPGHIAEFGVFKGETAKLMERHKGAIQSLWLFDSWEGCPKPSPFDESGFPDGGNCCCSYEAYQLNMEFGGYCDHLSLRGFFENTLPCFSWPLAFAHIDCDLYEGTKQVLNHILPLMVMGGSVIVDDYSPKFPGVMKAVNENTSGWHKVIIHGEPHNSVLLFRP